MNGVRRRYILLQKRVTKDVLMSSWEKGQALKRRILKVFILANRREEERKRRARGEREEIINIL